MSLLRFFLGATSITVFSGLIISLISCQSKDTKNTTATPVKNGSFVLIKSDYAEGEITKNCDEWIKKTDDKIKAIAALKPSQNNFESSLLAFEIAFAEFSEATDPMAFMAHVSPNEKIAAEASKCDEKQSQFNVEVLSRKDLYKAISHPKPRNKEEERLQKKIKDGFERSGIKLPDAELKTLTKLNADLEKARNDYKTHLNADDSKVMYTEKELEGAPSDFLNRLKKAEDGKYIVSTKSTDYLAVMENVKNPESRKKMLLAYTTKGGDKNIGHLNDAIVYRSKIAKMLGYDTWADFQTKNRMAKSKKKVLEFLNNLRSKLLLKHKEDLNLLLKYKKEIDPEAKELRPWDIAFLMNQLKKRDYSVDNEKVREYFPSDLVMEGMFKVYSKILGLKFTEVNDANVWSPEVKLFATHDAQTNKLIGYFFADLHPRKGKYGHAAAFTLIIGRKLPNGEYNVPVSSIVANFTPPSGNKPSLMTHDEVKTAFHEFGHIMHEILTRAPYGTLAGINVAWDFVEAPSQMLENWVWQPEILEMISGHYLDRTKKLPPDMIKQLVAARDFMRAYSATRQLQFALFDMTIHTQDKSVDVVKIYDNLFKEIMGIEPLEGSKFPASFGHMMGGYAAGYYGYLWSDVYAQDMFSLFEKSGLLSDKIGFNYRRVILEKGNLLEPEDLLKEFLGREPSNEAFFKMLGIKTSEKEKKKSSQKTKVSKI